MRREVAERERIIYPLVDAAPVDKQDVLDFFEAFPWNLRIPEHQGNCFGCYKKSDAKLLRLYREDPRNFALPVRLHQLYRNVGPNNVLGPRKMYRGYCSAPDLVAEFEAAGPAYRPPITDGGCSESCELYETEQLDLFPACPPPPPHPGHKPSGGRMAITAYPLSWPAGWKRTLDASRTQGAFGSRKESRYGLTQKENVTIAEATGRLLAELERMGAAERSIVLSTNLVLRQDGLPRSGQAAPRDPGAAVYWTDPFNGHPRSMAIDRYTKVEQNIAALAATVEAMRAIDRHGGAVVLERAFTGFSALPAPIVAGVARHWRDVLGFKPDARVTAQALADRYRVLASANHPDRGGDAERMAKINRARDEALKEI
ncbi:J domain-containing protein [Acidovorax sp. FG27]|uniref:J domain-containing protein n=1 Tax=Acidovorax sp. FG27 TaxID=3133652 RepID=UPI0030E8EAB1